MYNLESYPHKFVIEINKYNTYMFRQQRFFKGRYAKKNQFSFCISLVFP